MKNLTAILAATLFIGGQALAQSTPPTVGEAGSATMSSSGAQTQPIKPVQASGGAGASAATGAAQGEISAGVLVAGVVLAVVVVAVIAGNDDDNPTRPTGTTGTR